MTTKLALSVDETLIGKAKAYAHKHGTSVAKLVNQYLAELVRSQAKNNQQDNEPEIGPLTKAFTAGPELKLPKNFDYKRSTERQC